MFGLIFDTRFAFIWPEVVPKLEVPTSLFISYPPLPRNVQTASIYDKTTGVPDLRPNNSETSDVKVWCVLLPLIIWGNRFLLLFSPNPFITSSSYSCVRKLPKVKQDSDGSVALIPVSL